MSEIKDRAAPPPPASGTVVPADAKHRDIAPPPEALVDPRPIVGEHVEPTT